MRPLSLEVSEIFPRFLMPIERTFVAVCQFTPSWEPNPQLRWFRGVAKKGGEVPAEPFGQGSRESKVGRLRRIQHEMPAGGVPQLR